MSVKEVKKAQADWSSLTGAGPDGELDEKRKDRSYDPSSDAEKASISSKLNEDCAKMRGGSQLG